MKNYKNIIFLSVTYLLAHGLLLANRVIMWDGWLWSSLLKQKNYETLYRFFDQAGLIHMYVIYRIINNFGEPVIVSKILVFAGWLLAGLCVYAIIKEFTVWGEKNALFIAVLFSLAPIFIVRFEIALISYSLSNAVFFLGAYLFLRAQIAGRLVSKIILQILALVFLIGSFFTASFLVFYGALIIFAFHLFLKRKNSEFGPSLVGNAYEFIKKNILWILLPIVFYAVQRKFIGSPYGIYEGYNSFVFLNQDISLFSRLMILIDRSFQFIVYGFGWPIISSVVILQNKIFLLISLFFGTIALYLNNKFHLFGTSNEGGSDNVPLKPKYIFIWGILLFVFGAAAYILVGESPNPFGSGFDMRHGLILPLGFSLIIFAFIEGGLNKKIQPIGKIIIIALFITYNIYNYYTVDMDYYKQIGVIESLKEKYQQGEIGERDIFVFYDQAALYRWRGRPIRDYEYTGYLYEATGNPKLLGTDMDGDLKLMLLAKNAKLDFDDKRTAERFKNIIIDYQPKHIANFKDWMTLKVADLFFSVDVLKSLNKNLIGIKTEITNQLPKERSWLDKLP